VGKTQHYSKEEIAFLREKGICWARTYPEKLIALIRYFRDEKNTVTGLRKRPLEGIRVSTKTARKIKKLVQAGKLDRFLKRSKTRQQIIHNGPLWDMWNREIGSLERLSSQYEAEAQVGDSTRSR
jgi:hypothetical protein